MNTAQKKISDNKWFKFLIAFAVFFIVTVPFRYSYSFTSITEIRPATALCPFFGLIYGIPGVLGCAVANLVADIMFGIKPEIYFLSFPIQFLIGYIPYFLCFNIKFKKKFVPVITKRSNFETPKLDNTRHVIKYLIIMLVDMLITSFLLGFVMHLFGYGDIISKSTSIVFFNNLDFSCILGMPLIIGYNYFTTKKKFSLNERMIIFFMAFTFIATLTVGYSVYKIMSEVSGDFTTIWYHIYFHCAGTINVFILAGIILLIYLEKNVTIPIQTLSEIAIDYVKESEEKPDPTKITTYCAIYEKDSSEVGNLAKSYSYMVTQLDKYIDNLKEITAKEEHDKAELNVAAQIQGSLLPSIFPPFPDRTEFDIFASMTPAKEVGGDFYDFFFIDDDHLALVIADVSGKGIPASIFMAISKTHIKFKAQAGEISPSKIITHVNNQLSINNTSMHFVTVWMAVIEVSTGKGYAINAGHEHPVLKRANGKFELVKYRHSFCVGTIEGYAYQEHEFKLDPGDRLFVYTDGVPEATDANNELYGTDRMLDALNQEPDVSNEQLLKNVKSSVDKFVGEAPQFDDLTMLGFTYYGRKDV